MRKHPVDTRYSDLREIITDEAAQALDSVGNEHDVEVVLWETMLVASKQSPLLNRLLANPGVFIAAIYDTYGEGEYLKWRDGVREKLAALHPVDHQR